VAPPSPVMAGARLATEVRLGPPNAGWGYRVGEKKRVEAREGKGKLVRVLGTERATPVYGPAGLGGEKMSED